MSNSKLPAEAEADSSAAIPVLHAAFRGSFVNLIHASNPNVGDKVYFYIGGRIDLGKVQETILTQRLSDTLFKGSTISSLHVSNIWYDLSENNSNTELVNTFMGYVYYPEEQGKCVAHYTDPSKNNLVVGRIFMDYKHDWNALMPVVEKIVDVCLKNEEAHKWWNDAPVSDIRIFREGITVTWQTAIKFIQWYNSKGVSNRVAYNV